MVRLKALRILSRMFHPRFVRCGYEQGYNMMSGITEAVYTCSKLVLLVHRSVQLLYGVVLDMQCERDNVRSENRFCSNYRADARGT